MGVHIHHLPNIPDLQGTIVADRVKLVIFFVELNASDCVTVTEEGLNLLLVVNVPYSYNSIFSTTYHVLSVRRYGQSCCLIKVPCNFPVKLFTIKNHLRLALQIPFNQTAILGCSHYAFVIRQPFHCCDGLFVALDEDPVVLNVFCAVLLCYIVEKFVSLLQDFVF